MGEEKTTIAHCSKIIGDLRVMLPLIITLLGGTLYGNSATVKQWVHGPDDVVPTEMTENDHNAAINAKFQELEEAIAALKAESSGSDKSLGARLQSQINANKQAIEWLKN
jgi:hypothetical protein